MRLYTFSTNMKLPPMIVLESFVLLNAPKHKHQHIYITNKAEMCVCDILAMETTSDIPSNLPFEFQGTIICSDNVVETLKWFLGNYDDVYFVKELNGKRRLQRRRDFDVKPLPGLVDKSVTISLVADGNKEEASKKQNDIYNDFLVREFQELSKEDNLVERLFTKLTNTGKPKND